ELIMPMELILLALRAPRGQNNRSRDVTRRTVPVETPNSSALVNTAKPKAAVNAAKAKAKHKAVKGKRGNAIKALACWGNPQEYLQDKGVIDSSCSRHMIGNMSFLIDYEEIDRDMLPLEEILKERRLLTKCFDQTKTLQFPVVHPPPQETSIEILHDQEKNCLAFYNNGNDDDVDYTIAITPTEEPDNSLSMRDKHLDTIPATKSDKVIKSSVEDLVLIPSESEGVPDTMCDVHLVNNPTPLEAKDHFEIVINSNDDYSSSDDDSFYYENIEYELAEYINTLGWNRPTFYNNGDDDDMDYTIAITPVLSTEEPGNSLSMGDKYLDTILATKSDEVIKSSVEDLVPILSESEGILTPCVNLLIDKIEALKDNPTPSFEFLTKSSSTSPKAFLEETNTFDDSLPEFENFCFDLEEISSGSTTTQSDISLPEYDSFIFDLSNDQFPPTDRSDFTHEEFTDELAHIISPPEYDCFYFRDLLDLGEWISSLNSKIRENLSSTTRVNLPVEDDHSPLLAYVVWIFLAYLTYPIIRPYLYSFENEDTIFDPGITINRFYSFKPGLSHQSGTFKK
nr:hypothetical protein [Tanacetum cinerariifolium]